MPRTAAFIFIIFCLAVIFPAGVQAELFPLPSIPAQEELTYIIKPKKQKQYTEIKYGVNPYNNRLIISNRMEDTPEGKRITMRTYVKDEKLGNDLEVTNTFILHGPGVRQTRFVKRMSNLKTGEQNFYYEVNFLQMGKLFPPDCYTSEVFPLLLRGLDLAKKPRFEFFWWGSERSAVPMYTQVKGPKNVTVPAGTFSCYEVQIWADLNQVAHLGSFVSKVIKPFLPVYSNWFTVDPPHNFIMFVGPIGPPGTPEITMELMEIKPKEQTS